MISLNNSTILNPQHQMLDAIRQLYRRPITPTEQAVASMLTDPRMLTLGHYFQYRLDFDRQLENGTYAVHYSSNGGPFFMDGCNMMAIGCVLPSGSGMVATFADIEYSNDFPVSPIPAAMKFTKDDSELHRLPSPLANCLTFDDVVIQIDSAAMVLHEAAKSNLDAVQEAH